jgi:hypothetical protein
MSFDLYSRSFKLTMKLTKYRNYNPKQTLSSQKTRIFSNTFVTTSNTSPLIVECTREIGFFIFSVLKYPYCCLGDGISVLQKLLIHLTLRLMQLKMLLHDLTINWSSWNFCVKATIRNSLDDRVTVWLREYFTSVCVCSWLPD